MPRPAALLALALALVVTGCGGDEADPEEAAVRETVQRFYASAATGDGREACALADREFRETLGAGCPEGLTGIYAGEVPEIEDVAVDGTRATAQVSDPPPDDVVELVKEEGGWRIVLSGE